ncbi:MAG: FAD-binding protein [Planctomycetota bacterium]|nr:FAD-binding protein [Planctomycetota bacterium]MDA1262050.1 FAD-binding protein [Planctomycetota bacterium]
MTQTNDIHLDVLKNGALQIDSSEATRKSIADQLAGVVNGEIRFDQHDRMLYSTDASLYQVEPIGVVVPLNVADGIEAIRVCEKLGVPILARGGGTALAGQTVNHAVVIDFSANCRSILEIDPVARRVRVEPGVVLDQLNDALLPHGLMFGVDVATGSHATLGGMIGNNSAGANSILYGRTVEHLVSIDVVLADGTRMRFAEGSSERDPRVKELTRRLAEIVFPIADEIDKRIPKILRHVDGYNLDILLAQLRASTPGTFDRVNLAHLFCGSEGTLGVTVEAELLLVERPKVRGLAILGFDDVPDALRPLQAMLSTRPSAVELVDDIVIEMAKKNALYSQDVRVMPTPKSGKLGAVMYVQYFGNSLQEIESKMDQLAQCVADAPMVRHFTASAMEAAWRLRKAGEPLLHGVPGEKKPLTFVEDTAVDPARLAEFVDEFRAIVARHGTTAAYYAHASVGCLHIRPLVAISNPEGLATLRSIAVDVADLVVKYGGALSGEHGDGRVRSPLLTRVLGPSIAQAIRDIKSVFDPRALLNPGNLVRNDDPSLITSQLRARPDDSHFVHAPDVPTFFRYEREEGFSHALEQCNGAGLCRRMTSGGTMCPSYRVLKDERHSTRGRANALRLAVTGQLGNGGAIAANTPAWNDPQTKATLDLCLSCKACKTECPSNVDISKLKAEFTAQQFWQRGGVPWRIEIMGRIRTLNRIGSALWPISNWAIKIAPIRRAIAGLMHFSPRRSLPPFGQSLRSWMIRRSERSVRIHGPESLQDRPTVLLMPDCFSQWSQPDVGRAAVEVLNAFGYRVILPNAGCCGRAAISNGMLAEAARMSCETAIALSDAVRREGAVALLGLEPSCVSAIKDDWLDLKMSVDRKCLVELAAKTWMIEEWLDCNWDSHPKRPEFAKTSESVVLHAHCHQKALWGAGTSFGLLYRIFGDSAKTLATGCCGMAGGFGFHEANFDLSMRIGEQDLFAKLNEHPDAIVCAPGTSCRHQIADGVDRDALHPIELVARAIAD